MCGCSLLLSVIWDIQIRAWGWGRVNLEVHGGHDTFWPPTLLVCQWINEFWTQTDQKWAHGICHLQQWACLQQGMCEHVLAIIYKSNLWSPVRSAAQGHAIGTQIFKQIHPIVHKIDTTFLKTLQKIHLSKIGLHSNVINVLIYLSVRTDFLFMLLLESYLKSFCLSPFCPIYHVTLDVTLWALT